MTSDRIAAIRSRLEAEFDPDSLEIVDDSHMHAGHAGAKEGKGHFRIRITSGRFAGVKPLERHRMVYAALGELMQSDIHALQVVASAPASRNDEGPTER